jgi:hypothetical protein
MFADVSIQTLQKLCRLIRSAIPVRAPGRHPDMMRLSTLALPAVWDPMAMRLDTFQFEKRSPKTQDPDDLENV